jgi:hypothetical protein
MNRVPVPMPNDTYGLDHHWHIHHLSIQVIVILSCMRVDNGHPGGVVDNKIPLLT